ncbi:MAG: acetylglutamate kinase [Planctomycetes bacterium]|nr:acetylglutamate kinase [Planctomycetota bacterium]
MEEAIQKAAVLIEAHQYIRQFENATIVVKVGGSIMDDPEALKGLIRDVCFMDAVGMRPVVVHGGGKAINQAMAAEGLEAQFVQGRRYTDERTLTIAEHVLINDVNKFIVDQINAYEHLAMPLHSLASCVIFGKRLYLKGEDNRKIDVGYVGEVDSVNTNLLKVLIASEYIPVIAPIARDSAGGKLNINADSAAGKIAGSLGAEKLVLVSDTHGIRTGEGADTLVSHLTKAQIEELVEKGIISAGMLPKVEAAFTALAGGVKKVHIVDGRIPHSLLLEIFSRTGIGTEIVLE